MKALIESTGSVLGIAALVSVLLPLIIMQHAMEKKGNIYTYIDAPFTVPRDYRRAAKELNSSTFLFWWYLCGWLVGTIVVPLLIMASL